MNNISNFVGSFFGDSSTPRVSSTQNRRSSVNLFSDNNEEVSSTFSSSDSTRVSNGSEQSDMSTRSNGMSTSYVPFDAINLDDPKHNKAAIRYLLDKVQILENLYETSSREISNLQARIDVLENASPNDDDSENESVLEEPCLIDLSKLSNDLRELTAEFKETQTLCASNTLKMFNGSSRMEALESTLESDLENVNNDLVKLQSEVTRIGQYSRRENLIIDGIPNTIPQNELERVCVRIVNDLGFRITSAFEVQGCHRLGYDKNGFTPVIIRFTNRKVKEFCIAKRGNLKKINCPWNLSFREDMELENIKIEQICSDLKDSKFIKNYIVRNGFIKIFMEGISRPNKIEHVQDLRELFKEYFEEYYDLVSA